MAEFQWWVEHWPTVAAFEAHLAQHQPSVCAWVERLVVHHTVVPTLAQWKGRASMDGLKRYYQGLRWHGGPHLFVAPDGIWQGTPMNTPGVHAGACNSVSIGIEMVGNYDAAPWEEPIRSLAEGTLLALLRWRGLPASSVLGHRECGSTKTCPGRAIDMNALRATLAAGLVPDSAITPDTTLIAPARATADQAAHFLVQRGLRGYTVTDVHTIATRYWSEATAVGLDPLLVFAQMVLETDGLRSWWAQRPRRNPAGIGVTGEERATMPPDVERSQWAQTAQGWAKGLSFPSWEQSIPAHIGRVLAYALRDDQATPAQQARIAAALALRPLPAQYRGCAPTLRGLSSTWAADAAYAEKIAQTAQHIRVVQ